MRTEDLNLISKLGQALYANPARAESCSYETVAAISTLPEVTEDQFLERALELMLHQAERDGQRAGSGGVASPFFRLSPKERFALFLLHSGRVSYQRLGRLLVLPTEEVQSLAWIARTQIASSPEVRLDLPHPIGASLAKQACPEFNPTRPWTQKLLDDEMGTTELTFIQNHTTVCEECRRALARTREMYYAVEKWIPLHSARDVANGNTLLKAVRQGRLRGGKLPTDLTWQEALGLFFSKRENLIWLAVFAGVLIGLIVAKMRIDARTLDAAEDTATVDLDQFER
jgi:hypothetical protein